ncbi:MAG: HDOD domain-containing protein [Sedimenticola sp.]|uniref:HDOD domain-containing protein n=1 Tax=Sedimenticola thiotaurini TaxID=1543721 RepID=A0A558D773_9GAMM|nr:HDOD domain-containing protein [Sedimenticola sp.]TVT56848.1 MAG: HDOD domain-containing protein [Sedimenticola thiotaurini]MCW8880952.1 HDOD domain-containing protein [Sedimenticola sp.]MCW8921721.1 HDOD domain-containing protein [Sedimenticola sp.]MCW8947405.1 HDOD domain-containing protein [Sedimenticola sp.]
MSSSDNPTFDIKSFANTLVEDIEKNRIRLPTLPAISLEALLVVNDAGSSMADVAKIISKDTSMAARLVRYANSPLYRGVSTVSSVKAAITRIGFDAVKNAILSLAMRDVFTTSFRVIQDRMEALWKHSVDVATKATQLVAHFPHLNKDEAMLAGLIHDVGTIPVLIKAVEYPLLLEKEANLDKVIDKLHMPVGKFLLSRWNFDPQLVEVAASHDKLDRAPKGGEVDYVDIIQVANILSYQGTDNRWADIDIRKNAACKRVGIELILRLGEMQDEDDESQFSTMLN